MLPLPLIAAAKPVTAPAVLFVLVTAATVTAAAVREKPSNAAGANRFEDDLIALASTRLAGGAWEADQDPIVYLSRVSDRSRFAPRARLVEAVCIEENSNDAETAEALFLAGEEWFRAFRSTTCEGEAEDRIARGKAALEELMERYGACASLGIEPWNRAALCRTGEALVLFGDRIAESPPPAGLSGADGEAYRRALLEQSDQFHRAGEQALSDLLRSAAKEVDPDDEWIARAREILWPRLARRFLYMPEMTFPLVRGAAPEGDARLGSRERPMEKAPLGTTWSLRFP
jgi:hypothetical protein